MDKDKIRNINIDNVWAQASYLFHQGYQYWFDDQEVDQIVNVNNVLFETISAEEELVQKYFYPYTESIENIDELRRKEKANLIEFKTCAEILEELNKNTTIKLSQTKLGLVLKKLGFKQILIKEKKIVKRVYLLDKRVDTIF